MLKKLESTSHLLGIQSYGISSGTLEDVVCTIKHAKNNEEPDGGLHFKPKIDRTAVRDPCTCIEERKLKPKTKKHPKKPKQKEPEQEQKNFFTSRPTRSGRCGITCCTQLLAQFLKHILWTYRIWYILLIHLIIISILAVFGYSCFDKTPDLDLPLLHITMDSYSNPIAVITSAYDEQYSRAYEDVLELNNVKYLDWNDQDMAEKMMEETRADSAKVRMKYLIGLSTWRSNDTLTAWFNNEPLHTPPLSMVYALNAVAYAKLKGYSFSFSNFPYTAPSNDTYAVHISVEAVVGAIIWIGFAMAFATAYFIIFCIIERSSKFKYMQRLAGASLIIFWLVTFIWDYTIFLLMVLCMFFSVSICSGHGEQYGPIFLVILVYGFAILPIVYVISFLFRNRTAGYIVIVILAILLGPVFFVLAFYTKNEDDYLLLIPPYAVADAIKMLSILYARNDKCDSYAKNRNPARNTTYCEDYPDCCREDLHIYSKNTGITKNQIYMAIIGVIFWIILILIDSRIFPTLPYLFGLGTRFPPMHQLTNDKDVKREKKHIRSGKMSPKDHILLLKNVSKNYGFLYAVNHLCLGLKSECFGLIGASGAGKTATLKMISGDERISHGNIWVLGKNLKWHRGKVFKEVGYCPQSDYLLDNFTGRETILIYCLLMGLPYKVGNSIAKDLATELGFVELIDREVRYYSLPYKRRLSIAVSFLGDPSVLLLDEPSAGMDPVDKRNLWYTLLKYKDANNCILLATRNLEESQAICTRSAIMVNGELYCLGTVDRLKFQYGKGSTVTVTLQSDTVQNAYIVNTFMKMNFPHIILRTSQETVFIYSIPNPTPPLSKIFAIMEKGRREIEALESFSLQQSALEQVYLDLTEAQKNPENKEKKKKTKQISKNIEKIKKNKGRPASQDKKIKV